MEWKVIQIKETSGRNVPFVSIGRGQMDFNAVACDLVGDTGQFKYAQLLENSEKGKPIIAVRFLENVAMDSIPIKRKMQNGKTIKGMTVVNKGTISDVFGKRGSKDGMVRYSVELVEPNVLMIID